MKTDVALGILDRAYAAATQPEVWPEALGHLGQAFDCSCVSLVRKDLKTTDASAHQWGVDLTTEREYLSYWLPRNEFHRRTRVWRPGHIETDRSILPKRELLASDYYNGFLKPYDMHAIMRVTLDANERSLHLLSLGRPRGAGEFEESDIATLGPLVGHFQRAGGIARHVGELGDALRGFSDLLEHGTTGILLVSETGRVVFANGAARAMLAADCLLELRASRLSARQPKDDAVLQRLIAGATGQLSGLADARGGAMRLRRRGADRHDLTVVLGPLDTQRFSENAPAAFVLLTDPIHGSSRPAWMLHSLYGLTSAEVLVAEQLMKGYSPKEVATMLSIAVPTVRWHLRSLFQKTDTRRQSDLMRLLLSLPSI
jgi:DNA-binding CsgD family transcriptional regulator